MGVDEGRNRGRDESGDESGDEGGDEGGKEERTAISFIYLSSWLSKQWMTHK